MAIISCPNCGKQISDKAKACPGCGYVLEMEEKEDKTEKILCEECGFELSADMDTCPNCGCPVSKREVPDKEREEQKIQAVEVAKINLQVDEVGKEKAKKGLIAAGIVVLGIIIAFFGYRSYNNQQKEKAKIKYGEDIELTTMEMLVGASSAEQAGGLIHDVWYDTIYENDRATTKAYTKDKNGRYYDDFNTSLGVLFVDESFRETIDSITENQEAVRTHMKDLKSPPAEYEDAYEDIKTLYDWYTKFTELAVNPSGNLQSYTSSFNEADQGFMNAYKTMQMYFDD